MRQVNHNELLYNLSFALKRLPASAIHDLLAPGREQRARGAGVIARQIAEMLNRYEILSSAPLNHAAGDDLFLSGAQRGQSGVAVDDGGS